MTTNTERPVGPGTFTRNSHSVTIAEDGKILVKKDDWLSKYSWALYGDYDTLHVFVRPNPAIVSATQEIRGIKEIENVDLIETGEYLIHEPTYFHWMERRGIKPPGHRKPVEPVKPEHRRSEHWRAANLGGLDGVYFAGSFGAVVLAFHNLDNDQTYYYVLLRAGGGLGLEVGDIFKGVKNIVRAAVRRVAKQTPDSAFVPVMTFHPFSARSVEGYTINCHGWTFGNYTYEKITGNTSRTTYFQVVFEENNWVNIPGIGGSFTGGKLIWVW